MLWAIIGPFVVSSWAQPNKPSIPNRFPGGGSHLSVTGLGGCGPHGERSGGAARAINRRRQRRRRRRDGARGARRGGGEVVAARPLALRHRQRREPVLRGGGEAGAEPRAGGGRGAQGPRRRRRRRGRVTSLCAGEVIPACVETASLFELETSYIFAYLVSCFMKFSQ
uniref:Uncharacterized protein n=1 Tax=Oryza rufipogon TaxID=4529 RepID=A0A0E0NB76_ORYRU